MSQMGMSHDEHQGQHAGFHDHTGQWIDGHHPYHNTPQHQSPVQEFDGFSYQPMQPIFPNQMHSARTTHPPLQPLIMPQWPSMLTSQSSYVPPIFPTASVPIPPASTPISATSTRSGSSSTPRKTLTDADRRRMCLYHEEHPTVKQTEIGAMFGVERSTVSKVLRQKDKYLYQDDGSRSPIKRAKGKFPDIERALSNWARNHQKQGLPLSDAIIREKARFFAQTVGSSDSHIKASSTSWLEKFKQKNNLMGTKSRKNSLAEESDGGSNPGSSAQTPNGISPTSPIAAPSPSPVGLTAVKLEDAKAESPDSYVDFRQPFHSQSNNSLSSVFTDSATTVYSAGPTSPTSPFFTPDSACLVQSPFLPSQQQQQQQRISSGSAPPGSSNFQRPRSQTFPMLGVEQYISPPASSEPVTPKYTNSTSLDSPIDMPSQVTTGMEEAMQQPPPLSRTPSGSMQPPPVPAALPNPTITIPKTQHGPQQHTPVSPNSFSPSSPSQEEARRAMELVMSYLHNQPGGFVDPTDYYTMGKLMEKLKLHRVPSSEQLPGGLHTIRENDFHPRNGEGM